MSDVILLENARIFDGTNAECADGMSVAIEGGLIREVSDKPIGGDAARRIDLGGRTLMPGLIDLHIHAYASDVDWHKVDRAGEAFRTAHAIRMLGHALDCGFTTVRDIGGGDYSLSRAIDAKLFRAPRFFYAGKILSQTGGHGDLRGQDEHDHTHGYCSCGQFNTIAVVADGIDAVLKAVREELRRGAYCIKIMGSGGVSSPTDPIWMNQYREDEIRAIVGECAERRTFVSAHCHPTSAIRRCVDYGVRCIEHGTLIDRETADFVAERGAFIVPTMAIIFALVEQGEALGFPAASQDKVRVAYSKALEGMDVMRSAGVKMGLGTDLLGALYTDQAREFTIRREVFSPLEILRQATSIGAEILMQQGKLGCVAEGAHADLIVVDGDPLDDVTLLSQDGRALSLILRDGEIVKNRL
jgi:imidazolonepropionase-like amidohydrolase